MYVMTTCYYSCVVGLFLTIVPFQSIISFIYRHVHTITVFRVVRLIYDNQTIYSHFYIHSRMLTRIAIYPTSYVLIVSDTTCNRVQGFYNLLARFRCMFWLSSAHASFQRLRKSLLYKPVSHNRRSV